MEKIEIRKATINDIDQLQKIARQTFVETYASSNSEENMNVYLEEGFSTEKINSELMDENAEFYFAELNNHVIAYLKVNAGDGQTEIKKENSLEIERIYVLKEFQGKRIGQMLYDKAVEISKQKHVDFIWLGVWEKNPAAIGFYKKNGFVEFDKHVFKLGNEDQTDIMMKLNLNKNSSS